MNRSFPQARAWLAGAACAVILAACGGGASSQPAGGGTPASGSLITALETSGTVPTLGRSTSLTGPDANGDGVRDDIAQWIAQQPATTDQKSALLQLASALQQALLVDLNDQAALLAVSAREHAAVKCVVRRHVKSVVGDAVRVLERMTANTRERAHAYLQYANAMNGSVSQSPEGDGCAN